MARIHQNDLVPGPVRGVNRSALWTAWKAIRKEVKNSSVRDVVDFLDYDVNPDVWINRLLQRVASGEYEPEAARRFTLGKSKGFSRTMTLLWVPQISYSWGGGLLPKAIPAEFCSHSGIESRTGGQGQAKMSSQDGAQVWIRQADWEL
jgi:hypothetical protein